MPVSNRQGDLFRHLTTSIKATTIFDDYCYDYDYDRGDKINSHVEGQACIICMTILIHFRCIFVTYARFAN